MAKKEEYQNEVSVKKDKRMLSLFIALFPALILAMISNVTSGWARIMLQIVLIFFQAVVLKNILDDYYRLVDFD